jgi:DNA topoisomerase-1
MGTLLIVESPTKAKKIQSYLQGVRVLASAGHIRDLPEDELGVEPPDYKPKYVITKPDVVGRLKKAALDADTIIIATDPDREGEAIAFHLYNVLGRKDAKRATFNEVTKAAVEKAIANTRTIDVDLVRAQEARRILDRLVGYRVSPALSRAAGMGLSAGRVQSVAVRLVVDRQRAIDAFKPEPHYGVKTTIQGAPTWAAGWNFSPLLQEAETIWRDRDFAQRVADTVKQLQVAKVEKKAAKRAPPAPFTTSTMTQAASSALKMSPEQTAKASQELFEAGAITYHRTDEPNLSADRVQMARDYLQQEGKGELIAKEQRSWKAKAGAQGAHEAIAPTDFAAVAIEGVSQDAGKLYELIRVRALASAMADELLDVTTIELQSSEEVDGRSQAFAARGQVQTFAGWRSLLDAADEDADDKDGDDETAPLPALAEGQTVEVESAQLLEKKTKGPAQFTEATLVRALEAEGVGRPSTYAAILKNITTRGYIEVNKRKVTPTQLGELVRDALVGRFAFAEVGYTREVENTLDEIEGGRGDWRELVRRVDGELVAQLPSLEGLELGEQHNCPQCGARLRRRKGKDGHFWGCSAHPECGYTAPDDGGRPGERKQIVADEPCPDCGRPLVLRDTAGGKFFGCSGYPECKTTVPAYRGKPVIAKCECGGLLRRLKGRDGHFWGCSNYPNCKKTVPDKKGRPDLAA